MTELGKNIKAFRKAKGMTQDYLAGRMNITRQAISAWETGKSEPDVESLKLLSEIFDTDINELLGTVSKTAETGNNAAYKKMQKRFIIISAITGVLLISMIVAYSILDPIFREYMAAQFDSIPLMLLNYLTPPYACLIVGIMIISLISLKADLSLSGKKRIAVLIAGIIFTLPVIMLTFDGIVGSLHITSEPPFWYMIFNILIRPVLNKIVFWVIPFAAGACIMLGSIKRKQD